MKTVNPSKKINSSKSLLVKKSPSSSLDKNQDYTQVINETRKEQPFRERYEEFLKTKNEFSKFITK